MALRIAHSIEEFDQSEWNNLYPGEIEDWRYYRAVEQSGLPGFQFRYLAVYEGERLDAAVPAFVTEYRLDTTLQGWLKRVTEVIDRALPGLLRIRLFALGSPVSEICHLGFHTGLDPQARAAALDELLGGLERCAAAAGASLIAVKDACAPQHDLWHLVARRHGLRPLPSLPTAVLPLPYASIDAYLAQLSRATRKDMRRKLRSREQLRVEWRSDVSDLRGTMMELYRDTLGRSELRFEELTDSYFTEVAAALGQSVSFVLYWFEQRLLGFNLVLHDQYRMIDKFLCMDYGLARRFNLYFVSWFENVRWCIEHGLGCYQSGQASYQDKVRLGSQLAPNWLWYRHRRRWVDWIFARFERWFGLDRHDPDIAALVEQQRP